MPKPAGADSPPTPAVGLGALLADQALELRLVAGPERAEVHGVHASEMADPSPYLLGGELLLTAGAGDAADAADGADAYVRRLVGSGVAALGFGVAPLHAEVPPALAEACVRHGLPLLEVPPQTRFTAVARAVWRLMAEARTRELRRVTEAQQALAAAAARPDPVPAVLARLAASLSGWAALLTPAAAPAGGSDQAVSRSGAGAAGSGPAPGPAGAAAEGSGPAGGLPGPGAAAGPPGGPAGSGASGVAPGGPAVSDAAAATAGAPVGVVRAAGAGPAEEALVAVRGLARRVAGGAAATATDAVGGTHLAVYTVGGGRVLALAAPVRAPGDHAIASIAAVLLALLTADRPAGAEAAALARLLLGGSPAAALGGPGPWYAVHARGGADPQALAAALGTVLLDPDGPAVRLLTDREPSPQPGWRLGVSAPAGPDALAGADAQARRALDRAEAARTLLARHADSGFAGLVGEAEARAHAEALLGPLSPALRDTLRAWLAHHGSWDRSAAALGVHRNTVRQRIARAASLLGRDLDDPDTRMELWFALRRAPEA
ncbi:PucR family transcriptional regulator [Streptomyces sp. NRRL S-244]|uniref:PucR family transcriptional regulator n=1 Tax=Streptomyces sp. NRRL S-244 TaxID=1463897 RepID=UPI0009968612|nr:PucR family transcriptional regulator [Streptomyces sp. NRRL S-244]